MELTNMSVEGLVDFLKTEKIPGTQRAIAEDVVTSIQENRIDGATLLLLMEDLAELKEVVPNTAHRLQLKRIISNTRSSTESEIPQKPTATVSNVKDSKSSKEMGRLFMSEISSLREVLAPIPQDGNLSVTPTCPVSTKCTLDVEEPLNISIPPPPESPAAVTPSSKPLHMSTPTSNDRALPTELPTPQIFSIRVEEAIRQNQVSAVRLQLIKDAGNFYYGSCRHPKQGDYGRMARKLCERFPELKCDKDGSNYWSAVARQLSMFFRNQRRLSKVTHSDKENSPSQPKKTAKKIKLGDDVVASARNIDLLKKAQKSDFSAETYGLLIKDTHNQRREFIEKKASSVAEILEECPFLRDPDEVKAELVRMLGEQKVSAFPGNIRKYLKAVLKMNKATLTNQDVLEAISRILKRTRKRCQPGELIRFCDPSTPPQKMFNPKIVQFVIVCIGSADDIRQVFIAGENQAIYECPTDDLLDALFHLIAAYYVFHVNYPLCLEGALIFLQDLGLSSLDAMRSSKYSSLVAEIRHFITTQEQQCSSDNS